MMPHEMLMLQGECVCKAWTKFACLSLEETRRAGGQGSGKAVVFWKGNLLLVLVQGEGFSPAAVSPQISPCHLAVLNI